MTISPQTSATSRDKSPFQNSPPPLLQMIRLYNEMLLVGANYIYVEEFQ